MCPSMAATSSTSYCVMKDNDQPARPARAVRPTLRHSGHKQPEIRCSTQGSQRAGMRAAQRAARRVAGSNPNTSSSQARCSPPFKGRVLLPHPLPLQDTLPLVAGAPPRVPPTCARSLQQALAGHSSRPSQLWVCPALCWPRLSPAAAALFHS